MLDWKVHTIGMAWRSTSGGRRGLTVTWMLVMERNGNREKKTRRTYSIVHINIHNTPHFNCHPISRPTLPLQLHVPCRLLLQHKGIISLSTLTAHGVLVSFGSPITTVITAANVSITLSTANRLRILVAESGLLTRMYALTLGLGGLVFGQGWKRSRGIGRLLRCRFQCLLVVQQVQIGSLAGGRVSAANEVSVMHLKVGLTRHMHQRSTLEPWNSSSIIHGPRWCLGNGQVPYNVLH